MPNDDIILPGSCLPMQASAAALRRGVNHWQQGYQVDGIRNFSVDRNDVEYLLAMLQEHDDPNSVRLRERLERLLKEVPRVYDIDDQGVR